MNLYVVFLTILQVNELKYIIKWTFKQKNPNKPALNNKKKYLKSFPVSIPLTLRSTLTLTLQQQYSWVLSDKNQ